MLCLQAQRTDTLLERVGTETESVDMLTYSELLAGLTGEPIFITLKPIT